MSYGDIHLTTVSKPMYCIGHRRNTSSTNAEYAPGVVGIYSLNDQLPKQIFENDYHLLAFFGLKVEKLIEQGAYSKAPIYHCKDNKHDFAIKLMRSPDNRLPKHSKDELEVVKGLKHPNIIYHYAYFRVGNRVLNVMEYAPDGTLSRYIKHSIFTSSDEIKTIYCELLSAIAFLHGRLIAHRDIKDDNVVILKKDGSVIPKFCDFGFSIKLNSSTDRCSNFCGTRSYKAPELIHAEGSYIPFYSDMWSMGVLLHKMITKKTPIYSESKRTLTIENFKFPKWANDALKALLIIDPELRISAIGLIRAKWFRYIS